jgi:hypothetical protein
MHESVGCEPCRGLGKTMQGGWLVRCATCGGAGRLPAVFLRDDRGREVEIAIPLAQQEQPMTYVERLTTDYPMQRTTQREQDALAVAMAFEALAAAELIRRGRRAE